MNFQNEDSRPSVPSARLTSRAAPSRASVNNYQQNDRLECQDDSNNTFHDIGGDRILCQNDQNNPSMQSSEDLRE